MNNKTEMKIQKHISLVTYKTQVSGKVYQSDSLIDQALTFKEFKAYAEGDFKRWLETIKKENFSKGE